MSKRRKNDTAGNAARISGRVLVTLITLSAVIFGAFYLIGYDLPFDEEPQFTAPLLTDAVMWYIYVLTAGALVVTAVSVVREIRMRAKDGKMENGVPATRIAWSITALLMASLALTFALGSTEPLRINGREFSSGTWLRITDMFINTATILLVTAIAAVAFGMTGLNRKLSERIRR